MSSKQDKLDEEPKASLQLKDLDETTCIGILHSLYPVDLRSVYLMHTTKGEGYDKDDVIPSVDATLGHFINLSKLSKGLQHAVRTELGLTIADELEVLHGEEEAAQEYRDINEYKLVRPDQYDLYNELFHEDLSNFKSTMVDTGIYEVHAPVTLAFYLNREKIECNKSKAVTVESAYVNTGLFDPTPIQLRDARIDYVNRKLNEWGKNGVAFVYKYDDPTLFKTRIAGDRYAVAIVRYALVEEYLDVRGGVTND